MPEKIGMRSMKGTTVAAECLWIRLSQRKTPNSVDARVAKIMHPRPMGEM